jgi:hypothetical protein
MTEDQRQAADRPEAVRYRVHRTPLDAVPAGFVEASLQEAINEGSRQSWKLIKKPRLWGLAPQY